MEWIALALCGLLGGVLVISAISKFLAAHDFVASVANYPLMQGAFSGFVAFSVPWVELILGLTLLLGIELRWSGIASAAVLLIFSGAMSVAIAQGRKGSCGCGARAFADEIGWSAIGRNLVLIAAAISIGAIGESSLGVGTLDLQSFGEHPGAPIFATVVVAALLVTEAAVIRARSRGIAMAAISQSETQVIPWSSEILYTDARS